MDQQELDRQREMYVVKSNDFIRRGRFNLSLTEQRIVLYMISKIKPDDSTFDTVVFPIRDFCEVCGIQYQQNLSQLKESIKELADKSMWFPTGKGKQQTLIRWIEKPYLDQDSGVVKIRLDRDLMPYLLNIRGNRTQYELLSILALHSKHSIKLFELLKSYASLGRLTISVDDLRDYLQLENNYPLTKDFNKYVLNRATDDITAYTDIEVTYTCIRTGKRITGYEFTIIEQPENKHILARAYLSGKRPSRHKRDTDFKDVMETLQMSLFDESGEKK